MDNETLIKIMAGTAVGAGVTAAIASRMLYKRTLPRPKGTSEEIIAEFADPEKMAEYAVKMAPVGEWLEEQQMEEVSVMSQDGLMLHAYLLPASEPAKKVAILHHGFTSNAMDGATHAKIFHEMGFDVLMLDLRAHGKSEGEYVGFGILDRYDTMEWIRYSRGRFGTDVKIVLHGVSMGAATVLMALGLPGVRKSVSAVIADCAFTSPDDIFSHVIKKNYHLPPAPILKATSILAQKHAGYRFDEYSTLDALTVSNIPVLLIHGKEDKFVPTWMSEKNYEACQGKKKLLFVENAGHGSSVFEDYDLYAQTEKEFLDEVFAEESEAVNEEPEAVNEEPEAVSEEPEAVSEEPEAVSEEPETLNEKGEFDERSEP